MEKGKVKQWTQIISLSFPQHDCCFHYTLINLPLYPHLQVNGRGRRTVSFEL